MSHKMPRGYDHEIRKQIDMNVEQGEGSYPKGRCLHCDKVIAVTASTIKRHLKGCVPYQKHRAEFPEQHPESIELTPRRSGNSNSTPKAKVPKAPQPVPGPAVSVISQQPQAQTHPHYAFPNAETQLRAAQYQAAKTIYVMGLPFGHLADREMSQLFGMLSPAFRPPTEDQLASVLLDQVYDEYYKKVRDFIDGTHWVNVMLYAPANGAASDDMSLTVCVTPVPNTYYYWTQVSMGSGLVSPQERLERLRPSLLAISNGNLTRIMSTTLSTEQNFSGHLQWRHCSVRDRLSHEQQEKLRFIFYNDRVLKQKFKTWGQLTEAEMHEMQNFYYSRDRPAEVVPTANFQAAPLQAVQPASMKMGEPTDYLSTPHQ